MVSQGSTLQSTTQKYLEIFDISNNLVIMQDGACSLVMRCTAINFDLYSEEEQDATIYAYAALLNSLSFPIEILIRSSKKDVTSYLDLLKDQEIHAYNPVRKNNIKEYREFVEQLVQERNVLEKKFYIIVTYTALEAGINVGSSLIPGIQKKELPTLDKHAIIEKALTNLEPRRDHLVHQFARIGLFASQLNTQELIQLFYMIYNPEAVKGVKMVDQKEYVSPLVGSSLRYAPSERPPTPALAIPEPLPKADSPTQSIQETVPQNITNLPAPTPPPTQGQYGP
ncbi:MAG TPA: hypothetical protein VLH19_01475 [Patescibacteria group bacterium]|nr:hypothetical protein [Patescibacteria group bacterium]